jgi:hypothetical protein
VRQTGNPGKPSSSSEREGSSEEADRYFTTNNGFITSQPLHRPSRGEARQIQVTR